MEKIIKILSLLLLISCGAQRDQFKPLFSQTDPHFQKYKDLFSRDYESFKGGGVSLDHVLINFVEQAGNKSIYWAVCVRSGKHREIHVTRKWYEQSSPELRELFMLHEMGHCVLNRSHNDAINDEGYGLSIMNTFPQKSFSGYIYYRDLYIQELLGLETVQGVYEKTDF